MVNDEDPITEFTVRKLIQNARLASEVSYSPYSKFVVGACVLGGNGGLYTGTNIENASYGLTMCAERVAIFSAISQGETNIEALCIYTPTDKVVYPCGACLQVLSEFLRGEYKDFKNNPYDPLLIGVCDTDDRYEGFLHEMYNGRFTSQKFSL